MKNEYKKAYKRASKMPSIHKSFNREITFFPNFKIYIITALTKV